MGNKEELEELRGSIDLIDEALYLSIRQRISLTTKVGELKKQHGTSEMCENRKRDIIHKVSQWANRDGISISLITSVYDLIIESSRKEQTLLINKKD
jgi:chorismate mutase